MLGIPYEKPAAYTRDYLEVLNTALNGPGPVDVENDDLHRAQSARRSAPRRRCRSWSPRSDRSCCRSRASSPTAPCCGWPTSARSATTLRPRITKAADNAGRPAPRIVAGIPVCLCANSEIDAAKERANRILAEAETSPNYQRLLDRGDARNVGDLCAAGDEEAILARFRRFADAGVTDLSVRLLPIGDNRDELVASKYRTRDVISQLAAEVR